MCVRSCVASNRPYSDLNIAHAAETNSRSYQGEQTIELIQRERKGPQKVITNFSSVPNSSAFEAPRNYALSMAVSMAERLKNFAQKRANLTDFPVHTTTYFSGKLLPDPSCEKITE